MISLCAAATWVSSPRTTSPGAIPRPSVWFAGMSRGGLVVFDDTVWVVCMPPPAPLYVGVSCSGESLVWMGAHLSVFVCASGVTCSVPTITTNLSGFANFMEKHIPDCAKRGVFVVDRRFKAPGESIEQMCSIFYSFAMLSRRDRVELRNQTERLSQMLDWKNLGRCYTEARHLALRTVYGSK